MKTFSIAFYNVENFYARHDNSDNETFIVGNTKKWNAERYATKLNQISTILKNIGRDETATSSKIIGLAEVENEVVLEDIISHPTLIDEQYDYVFYESLDERKINVALLYKKDSVDILKSKPLRVVFKNTLGIKSFTRDVLMVKTKIMDEIVHFFVMHLPSKKDGLLNQQKRALVLNSVKKELNTLYKENPKSKIVLMGDFNDTPNNASLIDILNTRAEIKDVKTTELFNPFVKKMNYKTGTILFKKQWLIFDQMLFSAAFFASKSKLTWHESKIYNPNILFKIPDIDCSTPQNTFRGKKYIGGPSDHFPVFSIINLKFGA